MKQAIKTMKKNKRSSKVSGKPLALTWLCLSPPTDSKTYFSNIRILITSHLLY